MLDNSAFDPEKIIFLDFKMTKGQVDTPEDFEITKVDGHQLDYSMELSFNLDDKLAKADFIVSIKTDSKGKNPKEASGNFHLVYFYKVENLELLSKLTKKNELDINPLLGNALSSVTYSTSRGILLTRLQGTSLQNCVLPIINPNKLLHNKKNE